MNAGGRSPEISQADEAKRQAIDAVVNKLNIFEAASRAHMDFVSKNQRPFLPFGEAYKKWKDQNDALEREVNKAAYDLSEAVNLAYAVGVANPLRSVIDADARFASREDDLDKFELNLKKTINEKKGRYKSNEEGKSGSGSVSATQETNLTAETPDVAEETTVPSLENSPIAPADSTPAETTEVSGGQPAEMIDTSKATDLEIQPVDPTQSTPEPKEVSDDDLDVVLEKPQISEPPTPDALPETVEDSPDVIRPEPAKPNDEPPKSSETLSTATAPTTPPEKTPPPIPPAPPIDPSPPTSPAETSPPPTSPPVSPETLENLEPQKDKPKDDTNIAAKRLEAAIDALPSRSKSFVQMALAVKDREEKRIEDRYGDQRKLWNKAIKNLNETWMGRFAGGALKVGQGAFETTLSAALVGNAGLLFSPALFAHGTMQEINGGLQMLTSLGEIKGDRKIKDANREIDKLTLGLKEAISKKAEFEEIKTIADSIRKAEAEKLEIQVAKFNLRSKADMTQLVGGATGMVARVLIGGLPTGIQNYGGILANVSKHIQVHITGPHRTAFDLIKGWVFKYNPGDISILNQNAVTGYTTKSVGLAGATGHGMGAAAVTTKFILIGGLVTAATVIAWQARRDTAGINRLKEQTKKLQEEADEIKRESAGPDESEAPKTPTSPPPVRTTTQTSQSSPAGDRKVSPVVKTETKMPTAEANGGERVEAEEQEPTEEAEFRAGQNYMAEISSKNSEKTFSGKINDKGIRFLVLENYDKEKDGDIVDKKIEIVASKDSVKYGKMTELYAKIKRSEGTAMEAEPKAEAEEVEFAVGRRYKAEFDAQVLGTKKSFGAKIDDKEIDYLVVDDLQEGEENHLPGKTLEIKVLEARKVGRKGVEIHATIHHNEKKAEKEPTVKGRESAEFKSGEKYDAKIINHKFGSTFIAEIDGKTVWLIIKNYNKAEDGELLDKTVGIVVTKDSGKPNTTSKQIIQLEAEIERETVKVEEDKLPEGLSETVKEAIKDPFNQRNVWLPKPPPEGKGFRIIDAEYTSFPEKSEKIELVQNTMYSISFFKIDDGRLKINIVSADNKLDLIADVETIATGFDLQAIREMTDDGEKRRAGWLLTESIKKKTNERVRVGVEPPEPQEEEPPEQEDESEKLTGDTAEVQPAAEQPAKTEKKQIESYSVMVDGKEYLFAQGKTLGVEVGKNQGKYQISDVEEDGEAIFLTAKDKKIRIPKSKLENAIKQKAITIE